MFADIPWPTFRQVKQELLRLGCKYHDLSHPNDPVGYFERTDLNGKTWQAPVAHEDGEQLSDWMIAQICRRLNITSSSLGVIADGSDVGDLLH